MRRPTERTILYIGSALVFIMLLFPPWLHASGSDSGVGITDRPYSFSYGEYSLGYHFLFYPPRGRARVNLQLLLLQIGAVSAATFFLSRALRNR